MNLGSPAKLYTYTLKIRNFNNGWVCSEFEYKSACQNLIFFAKIILKNFRLNLFYSSSSALAVKIKIRLSNFF